MRTLLLVALGGCSYFATEAPRPAPGPTACNRDSQPVIADAIAGLGAAFAATMASVGHASSGDVIVPFALGGVFSASSVYGLVQVRRCRAAHEQRPAWSLAEMPAVM